MEITEALYPNTLHGKQTPASACSVAVWSDLAAAGAKMAAFGGDEGEAMFVVWGC